MHLSEIVSFDQLAASVIVLALIGELYTAWVRCYASDT